MKIPVFLVMLLLTSNSAFAQDCSASLAAEILQRNAKDQAARNALTGQPRSRELSNAVLSIDKDNTAFMRRTLDRCGWPKKSLVGSEAAKAAWRLTQHADMDPEYQILASRQLRYAVLGKEAEPWDLAVLVDRNRRLNDQPQVYGMQFFREGLNNSLSCATIARPVLDDDRCS